jgi:hypothetical protein
VTLWVRLYAANAQSAAAPVGSGARECHPTPSKPLTVTRSQTVSDAACNVMVAAHASAAVGWN